MTKAKCPYCEAYPCICTDPRSLAGVLSQNSVWTDKNSKQADDIAAMRIALESVLKLLESDPGRKKP